LEFLRATFGVVEASEKTRICQQLEEYCAQDTVGMVRIVERLADLGLFVYLWPDLKPHLKIDRRFKHCLTQVQRAMSWFKLLYLEDDYDPWVVYLLAIMSRSPVTVLINFCNRFQLPPKAKDFLTAEKSLADKVSQYLSRRGGLKNSEIFTALRELHTEGLLYLMAVARKSEVKKAVSTYVTAMRLETPVLNGDDLKRLGYMPGPIFKNMLDTLLLARLDGKVESREDELRLLEQRYPLMQ
jgi:tRNA nucleotidyltransferase (CCA-adding enzyme)